MMANWTPQYSTLLSRVLDGSFGTQKKKDILRDFCIISECIHLTALQTNRYLTGSRAEGLDLQGSDVDFMTEINTKYNINVIQSLDENTSTSPYSTFLMSTENVRPGFTLLQYVKQTPLDPFINQTFRSINGLQYLSSDLYMKKVL